MKITLRPVTEHDAEFLFALLGERTPEQSISHRAMPTMEKHRAFMASNPYPVWYIIESGHHVAVGQAYLTKANEIGLHVQAAFQGTDIASLALRELMKLHPRDRYLTNISPQSARALRFFSDQGFRLIQHTMEKMA